MLVTSHSPGVLPATSVVGDLGRKGVTVVWTRDVAPTSVSLWTRDVEADVV